MKTHCSVDAITASPRQRFHLGIPFLLVWALALPLVLLLAPLVFAACLIFRVNPFQGVSVYWQVFDSLRGLRVEMDDPSAQIRIY